MPLPRVREALDDYSNQFTSDVRFDRQQPQEIDAEAAPEAGIRLGDVNLLPVIALAIPAQPLETRPTTTSNAIAVRRTIIPLFPWGPRGPKECPCVRRTTDGGQFLSSLRFVKGATSACPQR